MLEQLNKIDWAHIHHSHGTAEEFPKWLKALADDDTAWRLYDIDGELADSPLNNIMEYSNHQGSIYQVTPYVVPFILQLLEDSQQKRIPTLLYLLQGYATGAALFSADNDILRQVFEKRGEDYDAKVRISEEWVDDTRSAIEKKIPLFLLYLEASSKQVRTAAAALLSAFKDNPHVKDALTKRLAIETNAKTREAINRALLEEDG